MTSIDKYFFRDLPDGLEGLAELALDLRWSASHDADAIWSRIAPEEWALTHNPWLILQTVAETRLRELAADADFQTLLRSHVAAYRAAMDKPAWFQQAHAGADVTIAYFCMEYGLGEFLPIYSGGLGILAGDTLKTVSDLGVPLVAVGLLYQQGYFRQALDARGGQIEYYPFNDHSQLPIAPVRDADGEWVFVDAPFPGRPLRLQAWQARVGRTTLYLLDSNLPVNSPADRSVTSELYGGGEEMRLQQEIALGIGGWRLLEKLGIHPQVCHLNEGHAALATLARARAFMAAHDQPFDVALAATRAGNIFTTHTPVPAGFDRFPRALMAQYLEPYADELGIGLAGLLALGRRDPADEAESFNMAYLAIRGSRYINGVSRLHGQVSRRLFQPLFPRWPQCQVPVSHVTNGVHVPSWESAEADHLWAEACGKERWNGDLKTLEQDLRQTSGETLWDFRSQGRQKLVAYARERVAWQLKATGAPREQISQAGRLLDPNALTLGFARRFATYKRPTLLLRDPERLIRLLNDQERPVQLIIAGKAHPHDLPGKALIQAWSDFIRRPDVPPRVVFLADYDMTLAQHLVQGVDVWINTPRRPMEASGTSGMKVLVNGGVNLSELDGWWAEAYDAGVGWSLGDGREHDDPAWDAYEAEQLYRLLEQEVVPEFYDRDANGVPQAWVARMQESMATLTARFSANRMVRDYVEHLYLPAAEGYRARSANGAEGALLIRRWQASLEAHWDQLHFGDLAVQEANGRRTFTVPVYLGDIDPDAVDVQLYADPVSEGAPCEVHVMSRSGELEGAVGGHLYRVEIAAKRPASDYTPRIVPRMDGVAIPLEEAHIRWYR